MLCSPTASCEACYLTTELHCVTSQMVEIFIFSAVRSSGLIQYCNCLQNSLKVFMICINFHPAILVYSSLYRSFIEGRRILNCVFCSVIYIVVKLNLQIFFAGITLFKLDCLPN